MTQEVGVCEGGGNEGELIVIASLPSLLCR